MMRRSICRVMLCCLALLMLCGTGVAENKEPILKISILADQQAYKANETAKVTITVENTSDRVAANVSIDNILPDGLVYASQQTTGTFKHAEIQPHASVQHEVYVRVVDVKLPQTGDNSPNMLILMCLGLAGMVALILISMRATGLHKGR